MADIEINLIAAELGKSLKNLAPQVEAELQAAVQNLAQAAYASIVSQVQKMSMDPKNRQSYLKSLHFQDLGDATWLIYLDGDWAQKLEEGYGSYSIKDVLLKSTKTVEVGSRAGQPWVRKNKKGGKYAAVPFEHKPFSGEKTGDLASDIKKLMGRNRAGNLQPITEIFKDLEGKPLSGKVAVAHKMEAMPKNLENLTKYQHVSDSGKVSSVYMTYRMVSENSTGWTHPGHKGYQLFEQAQKHVEEELKNILTKLL